MKNIKSNLFLTASGLFCLGAIVMAIMIPYGFDIKIVEMLPLLVLEVISGVFAVYYNRKYKNQI